jgi:pyruvate/2-oxoglutarate/acetoin dehydrogenase E1 component
MPSITMVQAINSALREEMEQDKRIIVLGEDVGKNGGVFRVTEGLFQEFGDQRVIDTPLSESGIIGMSIGLALYGFRPIAEIQFTDFVYPGFDQIISELAKLRYRTGGEYSAPVVIRTPTGGGIKGGPYHSQSTESFFAHIPGLKVVTPSSPYNAKGLMKSAIHDDDPVVFLEPKRLYRTIREDVPETEYSIPIGKARNLQEGDSLTIITYGSLVPAAVDAVAQLKEKDNVSAELIDLQTLVPLDTDAILESVRKTGRVVIAYEAPKFMGFGAEVAAMIAEEAIESLKAPIVRMGGFDTPFPFAHEMKYMPGANRILASARRVMTA